MKNEITTSDILPFAMEGYFYRPKKALQIEYKPGHMPGTTLACCDLIGFVSIADDVHLIADIRQRIHHRCQHYVMAEDKMLTVKGILIKRELEEHFQITTI